MTHTCALYRTSNTLSHVSLSLPLSLSLPPSFLPCKLRHRLRSSRPGRWGTSTGHIWLQLVKASPASLLRNSTSEVGLVHRSSRALVCKARLLGAAPGHVQQVQMMASSQEACGVRLSWSPIPQDGLMEAFCSAANFILSQSKLLVRRSAAATKPCAGYSLLPEGQGARMVCCPRS